MAEHFLEEPLKRIREMTRQVARLRALHDTAEAHDHDAVDEGNSAHNTSAPARPRTPRVRDRRRRR